MEIAEGANAMLILLSRVLIDAEVSFCLMPEDREFSNLIAGLTYSRLADPNDADFLIVRDSNTLSKALVSARIGTLVAPHLGATILVEMPSLATPVGDSPTGASGEAGIAYELSGPGIETTRTLHLLDAHAWLDLRDQKNAEFPMGVDLVLFDADSHLVALPRTTKVRELSWAT